MKFNILFIIFYMHTNLFAQQNYFINDNSTANDIYTTAIGDNANNGTSPSTPKETVANLLSTYTLNPGDTVFIDVGTYSETGITFTASDSGNSDNDVVFIGAVIDNEIETHFNTAASAHTFIFNNNVQYLKFLNIKISKNSISFRAINTTANGLSNLTFYNCSFRQFGQAVAINFENNNTSTSNNNITFKKCVINATTAGTGTRQNITFSGNVHHILLDSCFLENNGDTPTSHTLQILAITEEALPSNVIISNNQITSSRAYSIHLSGFNESNRISEVIILNNTINHSGSTSTTNNLPIRINSTTGVTIIKNRINGGYSGISSAEHNNGIFVNNYISNSNYGIDLIIASTNAINIIYNSVYAINRALSIAEPVSTQLIENNIFYITGTGHALHFATFGSLITSLDHNLYYHPSGNAAFIASTTYATLTDLKSLNKVSGASNGEENAVEGNPLYEDPSNLNLDINDLTSPAVGSGKTLSISDDINNSSRNTPPTIGAFEAVPPTPLPVTFLSFSSTCISSNETRLEWQTASEQQNDYFTVELSTDGFEWNEIGRVKGAGNTSSLSEYTYTTRTLPGVVYYRLKQTDYDGKFEYLSVISSICSEAKEPIVYPNPSNGRITISQLQGTSIITVYNNIGQKVVSITPQEKNTVDIDLSTLSNGLYLISIENKTTLMTYKLLLNN